MAFKSSRCKETPRLTWCGLLDSSDPPEWSTLLPPQIFTQPRLVGLRVGKCFNSTTQNQKIHKNTTYLPFSVPLLRECWQFFAKQHFQPTCLPPCHVDTYWQLTSSKKPSTLELFHFLTFPIFPEIFWKKISLEKHTSTNLEHQSTPSIATSIPYLHQLFGSTQLSATGVQLGPCFRTLEYHRAGGHQ